MEEIYLKDELNLNEQIYKWDFIAIGKDEARIYYKLKGNAGGFNFCVVEFAGHDDIEGYDKWSEEGTMIERMYRGWAAFDGIRHLHMGCDDNERSGYLNYPDAEIHAEIFIQLRELEKKYCSEFIDE